MTYPLRLLALSAVLVTGSGAVAHAESPAGEAHRQLAAALAAVGGNGVVAAVHALRLEAVGHRNMLEQSLRPEGPWWQDYMQLDVIRDFDGDSERVAQQHRGYSSPQWWLQHPQWDGAPVYPTYTWFTPEYLLELRNAVAREHLDVDTIFGMHYDPTPYKTAMSALDTFLKLRPPAA